MFLGLLLFHAKALQLYLPTFFCTGGKLSRHDPLDLARNHSHSELNWRKTPRVVKEEGDKCFQVRRDQVASCILV